MQFDWRGRRVVVLVLDMQASFIAADGPFQNTVMDPVIARLNAFLAACRARFLPIAFCQYVLRADRSDAGLLRGAPFLAHLLEDSPGIGLDPRVQRAQTDIMLCHHRPSAFFDTNLTAVMAGVGATGVVLTGVSVNNAVSATARDAFARDLPALVVRDCCAAAPFEPVAAHSAYFDSLDTWTAEVVTAAQVWVRLAASDPADRGP
jgi:nicotinamidase-related amidase